MLAKILLVLHHMFLPVKPKCYLWEFIFEVCQSIGILCKVDVKPLSVLCVEVVHSAIELNEFIVMAGIVKFWDVEVPADTKRDKDITV